MGRLARTRRHLRFAMYPFGQNTAGYLIVYRVEFNAGLTDAALIPVEGRFRISSGPTCASSSKPPCPAAPSSLGFPHARSRN
jgi:hypothetical protein